MAERGVEVIAFSTRILKGAPIGFPCPNFEMIRKAAVAKLGDRVRTLDHTH